jgi:glycine dehydrogenase
MKLQPIDEFRARHIGPRPADAEAMLETIGAASLESLIDQTIPHAIRLRRSLDLRPGMSEARFLDELARLAARNQVFRSFIGMGYYDCVTPAVIRRNLLENPGWYTPYTPYQAEIAQGRLEALLNFQTMVSDLTGMDVANASLLDEGTAAAEAMTMLHRARQKGVRSGIRNAFFVSDRCFPQTIDVLRSRSDPLGIELRVGDACDSAFADVFGVLLQYPDDHGAIRDLGPAIRLAHEAGALVAVAADLLSLALLTPPGEMNADVVVGTSQRFGVPLGYGGPHAGYFATRERYVRQVPGRLIGVSIDAHGNPAYRMALQTREQHIRREKATSNICTAQALLASIAGMYAVYHGPDGLRRIATRVHLLARMLEEAVTGLGYRQTNAHYFDTLRLELDGATIMEVRSTAEAARLNFRYFADGVHVGISLDETTTFDDLGAIVDVFARAAARRVDSGGPGPALESEPTTLKLGPTEALSAAGEIEPAIPEPLRRTSAYLMHPVFNRHHSETEMMRYIRSLDAKDVGLETSMIPLGSCTMKLNAAAEMIPVTWPEFSRLHPFAPREQAEGYTQIFAELEAALAEITGLPAVSLQPNAGAQGEFAGLMVIRAYHHDRGEPQRDVVLIPASAHGTNPASAVMAGMKVVVVATDASGSVDVGDLRARADQNREHLAALMITYPSTTGVFEESVQEICRIVHERGGQVYMDGANMNAQVGLTNPAIIGADVCHLNLHKTFAIPHGGGGPGMGPIAVAAHLAPYLPGHAVVNLTRDKSIPAVAAAPWGSASILVISYAYIRMLGAEGLTEATKYAILNANYVKARLAPHYGILFARNGRVAHEMIFDLRPFRESAGIDEADVAKRLMDYGFHAPTVSWPVPGTMMIEPTESEPREELDRFCDALVAIRREIQEIAEGRADRQDNILKNAPHTAAAVVADHWTHPYSRERAAFPLPFVRARKFWPSVGRIDQPYGDRNLVCSCPAIEAYEEGREAILR